MVIKLEWTVGNVKPMEPQPYPEPFDSSNHFFEIKWDGMRLLAFIKDKEVRLQNRNLQERTTYFPELTELYLSFKARNAVIDGELIALAGHKPSFPLLMKRIAGSPATAAARSHLIPVIYIPFDILFLEEKSVTQYAFTERREMLEGIFQGGEHCVLSPLFRKEGRSLFQMVKAKELEGIVAKDRSSPYLMGKKSRYWLKIKNRRRLATVIGGYVTASGCLNSILVGCYRDRHLHYLGRVGSGLKRAEAELVSLLPSLVRDSSPFHLSPRSTLKVNWVEPLLVAEIEYLEWTADLKLRQPVFIKLLSLPPESCRLDLDSKE